MLRSRGEHVTADPAPELAIGSPPLARRALNIRFLHETEARLTSARAESTAVLDAWDEHVPAHLRSRGEHRSCRRRDRARDGSPPLARRAPPQMARPRPHRRLTSARAESTTPEPPGVAAGPAHLRSRGEHQSGCTSQARQVGSPPLARRARRPGRGRVRVPRLTSARAESTRRQPWPARGPAAHLRSRGEHTNLKGSPAFENGSPPLARRAPVVQPGEAVGRRLTSARAESTRWWSGVPSVNAAHLRSRGEHSYDVAAGSMPYGSPPLARRAHRRIHRRTEGHRLTSARAESTPAWCWAALRAAAHLRSRGEHGSAGRTSWWNSGSPPLARRARPG